MIKKWNQHVKCKMQNNEARDTYVYVISLDLSYFFIKKNYGGNLIMVFFHSLSLLSDLMERKVIVGSIWTNPLCVCTFTIHNGSKFCFNLTLGLHSHWRRLYYWSLRGDFHFFFYMFLDLKKMGYFYNY